MLNGLLPRFSLLWGQTWWKLRFDGTALNNLIKCYLSRQQMEEKPFDIGSVAMCPAHDMKHRCLSAMAKTLENENLEESN